MQPSAGAVAVVPHRVATRETYFEELLARHAHLPVTTVTNGGVVEQGRGTSLDPIRILSSILIDDSHTSMARAFTV